MRGLTEIVTGTSTTPAEEATDRSPATKILTQSVGLLDILDQAVVSAGIFADASLPSVVETTKFADRAYKALADMAAKAPGGRAAIPARSHKKYGGEYDYWYRAMDRVAGDDGDDVSRMLMTMRAATQDDDTWTWADKMLNIVGGIKEHARGAGSAYDRDKKKANVTVNLKTQTAQTESALADAERVLSEALKPVAATGPSAERQKVVSQAQAGIDKMLQALDMVRQWVASLGIGKSDKTGAAAAALKAAAAELKGATAEEVEAILAVIDEAKQAKPSEDAMRAMDGLTRLVDGLRTLQGMMRQAKVGQGILDKLDAAIAGLKATRDFIHQSAMGGAPATESREGVMRGSWLTSMLAEAKGDKIEVYRYSKNKWELVDYAPTFKSVTEARKWVEDRDNKAGPWKKDGAGARVSWFDQGAMAWEIRVTSAATEGAEPRSNLSEAMDNKAVASLVVRLAELTDANDHTGALVLIAQTVFPSNKRMIAAWKAIQTLHDYRGSMDSPLRALRDRMTDELMAGLKSNLTPEQYQAIYGAM